MNKFVFPAGYRSQRKKLKDGAVPSKFPWSKASSGAVTARDERIKLRCANKRKLEKEKMKSIKQEEEMSLFVASDSNLALDSEVSLETEAEGTFDQETQTDFPEEIIQPESEPVPPKKQKEKMVKRLTIEDLRDDAPLMHFYTGLENMSILSVVLASLGPAANNLKYLNGVWPSISVPDQLLLTLVKLRTYRTNFELSRMFQVTETIMIQESYQVRRTNLQCAGSIITR